jgi:glycosyltransferase involved in cell wall biosynthesis
MRILYYHQHFSTPDGSTGTRSYEMARALIARGHKVTMVCGSGFLARTGLEGEAKNGLREGSVDGIDIIEICLPYSNYDSLTKRAKTFLQFAFQGFRLALKIDYDLLFATSTPLTAGIPGILMRLAKPKKKFVFEVRDLWPELPRAMGVLKNPLVLGGLWALEQATYAAMHAGVGLSPGICEGMHKGVGAGKRVAMVPNGCDLDLFHPGKGTSAADDFPLPKIPQKGLCCIFTGAHGVANGLDAVLDAAKVLKGKNRHDISLLFIGDGKLKPRLQQRSANEGLDNCLFFNPISKIRLAEILSKVDVGMMILDNVQAFYYGTSPNKFFDYISSGLPILNNYPGWLAGLITENKCGIAVPPDNPDAFADALIRLADDSALRKRMGENSRRLAESEFSRDLLADRLVSFLEAVVIKAETAVCSMPDTERGSVL